MLTKPFALLTLGTLPLLAACGGSEPPAPAPKPAAPAKPAAAAPAGGGGATASISGKISFEGQAPAGDKIKLTPECKALHANGLERQAVKVKDGGLADVYVYVKSPVSGSYPAPTTPVVLDQTGCTYVPHVVALQVGQPLAIRNDDEMLHNIHPRPTTNAEFNIGQPRKGMESTKTFDKPEVMITVGCDVHPWMRSYISVASNPFFAVSAEDGSFSIKNLPAGEYEVEAVHEKLGKQTGKLTVKDGEAGKLDLSFKG
jgi:plastocyanin